MRTTLILIFIALVPFIFTGCDDLESEGVSRITKYPTFIIAGGKYVTVVKGQAFNDPGVTTEEGYQVKVDGIVGSAYIDPAKTQPADVKYTSSIDTNVPGMYIITYSAVNPEGFVATVDRYVFVLHEAANPSVDLSGHYTSGSSPEADITKVANGVFYSTNAWGGGSTVVIAAYLISTDGVNIQVPQQESLVRIFGYGTVDGTTLKLKMSRPTFGPPPLLNLDKNWTKAE